MSQTVELPTKAIKIEIPDDVKIVPIDSHGYQGESLTGRSWTKADLRAWCGNKSWDWITKNIIDNPRYSREIGAMEQHNQLIHSGKMGSPWRFKASVMAEFLDRHWEELPW